MRRLFLITCLSLASAACAKAPEGGQRREAFAPLPAAKARSAAPVTSQIAYTYGFDFELPSGSIQPVQRRHLALCDRLGAGCHVASMALASGGRDDADASLDLVVAADKARAVGDQLVAIASSGDGHVTGRTVEGVDLGKQIVDVEARLRGRQALADRLLAIVQTHRGTITDLVAAEKAYADVQEEIDTARSELADAQGRIAMSKVHIRYGASAGIGGLAAPIGESLVGVGTTIGTSLGALLSVLAFLVPWAAVLIILGVIVRRWRRRLGGPAA